VDRRFGTDRGPASRRCGQRDGVLAGGCGASALRTGSRRRWPVTPEKHTVTVGDREITLSNLDKVFFPEAGFTKRDLIDYYTRIAPVMLPHVRDRPLTLKRYPDGVSAPSFFEKHVPSHAPSWVRTVSVASVKDGSPIVYGVVCDLPTLIWAANLGTIEFHVPLWRVGRHRTLPSPPDQMVFDLDPGEGTTIVECCQVAQRISSLLGDRGLEGVAKSSGSKGLQVYARLDGRRTWDDVRGDALGVATQLEAESPDLVVSNMRKVRRQAKVLIDWSQNLASKTTVAAYSLRGRALPTVSTPVSWDEVDECARRQDPLVLRFTAPEVLDRVERIGDLFAAAGVVP
jgi:bifunctional non-homologous end joining protein LigD